MTRYFATAAKGTEDLLAGELKSLGAGAVSPGRGGVSFEGDRELALKANLWLRTAMRVLQPVAEFEAPDPDALYEACKVLPWPEFLTPRHTFAVDATIRDSNITHSQYAALRVKDAIVDTMRERAGSRPSVDTRHPDLNVVLHVAKNKATLSLDLSGEALFQRGYRKRSARAPLKETLAAAMVLAARWSGETPFCDPMCGSGTIAIEAALIAGHRAPGLHRTFGVERWPSFSEPDRRLLEQLRQDARNGERHTPGAVFASDRSAEAIEAAKANARTAHVKIHFVVADIREVKPLTPPGLIAFNPPYGERLGRGNKALKTLYWQLGQKMRTFAGHRIAVLAGHAGFEGAFGLRPSSRRSLFNGPIPCELLLYSI